MFSRLIVEGAQGLLSAEGYCTRESAAKLSVPLTTCTVEAKVQSREDRQKRE